MATISVLRFPSPDGAEEGLKTIHDLGREHLLKLHDAAIVTWPENKKKPKTRQLSDLAGAGADAHIHVATRLGHPDLSPRGTQVVQKQLAGPGVRRGRTPCGAARVVPPALAGVRLRARPVIGGRRSVSRNVNAVRVRRAPAPRAHVQQHRHQDRQRYRRGAAPEQRPAHVWLGPRCRGGGRAEAASDRPDGPMWR